MIFRKANRRRLWPVLAIFACLFVAVVGGVLAWTRYAGYRDLELALAESDLLDPYWRLQTIEAGRRPPPLPGANGFDKAMAAAAARPSLVLPRNLRQRDRLTRPLLNQEESRLLRAEIERAKDTFTLAREMVNFSVGRGPSMVLVPGAPVPVAPPYLQMLDVAKMMIHDVRVRLYDNDIAGSVHDVRAVMHMSQALEDEPAIMLQIVRVVEVLLAIDMLEETLAQGIVPEETLIVLQQELERAAAISIFDSGLRGHRAWIDQELHAVQTSVLSSNDLWAQIGGGARNRGAGFFTQVVDRARFMLFCGNLPAERARLLRGFNELFPIVKLPQHEQLPLLREIRARALKPSFVSWAGGDSYFGGLNTFCSYLEDVISESAVQSCAIAALAAERFRLANQRWPKTLEELIPTYLKVVPLDPFSGKPLKFKRTDAVFIIYSIGENGVDDDGTLGKWATLPTRGPDVGFILHDPDNRRRTTPPVELPER